MNFASIIALCASAYSAYRGIENFAKDGEPWIAGFAPLAIACLFLYVGSTGWLSRRGRRVAAVALGCVMLVGVIGAFAAISSPESGDWPRAFAFLALAIVPLAYGSLAAYRLVNRHEDQ